MLQHAPFTIFIVIITVLVSLLGFSRPEIQARLMLNPYLVFREKQFYRTLTSGFLHADYMHLLFNMLTFYIFAPVVEIRYSMMFGQNMGIVMLAILYLGAIVVSDLPTLFKYKDTSYYNSLGASGGVSAIVFANILFDPLNKLCLYGFICMPGFILGLFYVIYSYFQDKRQGDNVNHSAHLYGAIFGFSFTALIKPSLLMAFIEQLSKW